MSNRGGGNGNGNGNEGGVRSLNNYLRRGNGGGANFSEGEDGGEGGGMKSLQVFITFIILGYFGVKIAYGGILKFYPDKYYSRTIEINKNDGGDGSDVTDGQSLTSTYVPNNWNNEFSDFITLTVLSFIIFVFTNFQYKMMIGPGGIVSPSFLIGYIFGLGYPPLRRSLTAMDVAGGAAVQRPESTYTAAGLLAIIAIVVIISNYYSGGSDEEGGGSGTGFTIYMVTLILLLYGLFISRKQSRSLFNTKVYTAKNDKCATSKIGVIQTSGERVNFSIPFIAFVVLLLFKNDPRNPQFRLAIYFLFGLLLGILVSGISYYGIEYFLEKLPEKRCDDVDECTLKDMEYDNKSLFQLVKEYMAKVMLGLGDTKKQVLESAEKIMDEEYANEENRKSGGKPSAITTILNKIGGGRVGFVDRVRLIATILLVVGILGVIYLAFVQS